MTKQNAIQTVSTWSSATLCLIPQLYTNNNVNTKTFQDVLLPWLWVEQGESWLNTLFKTAWNVKKVQNRNLTDLHNKTLWCTLTSIWKFLYRRIFVFLENLSSDLNTTDTRISIKARNKKLTVTQRAGSHSNVTHSTENNDLETSEVSVCVCLRVSVWMIRCSWWNAQ